MAQTDTTAIAWQPSDQSGSARPRDHPRTPGPWTRAYLQRKEAEGKTRMKAMRRLKRHLARPYHRLLRLPPVSTATPKSACVETILAGHSSE
jgi:hypothetical protein